MIESAVTNLIDKAAKVDELQAIVDQHTAAEAEAHETEITNYVTEAVTSGKVTEAVKDSLINLAKTDFEAVKNIIDTAKPAPLMNGIIQGDHPEPEMTKVEAEKIYNQHKVKNTLGRWFEANPEEFKKVNAIIRGK